ncbi:Coiled-coil domain-containing protein 87 [Phytophthora citrophthora]|uniref:Coiled-coil domain-containing protein 87 n=1 Tax=Phytophthora citrophthora TaxID=4793 RepID=A0AAD9LMW8_9STRA|nr:Coiled-coil domain-containing protein 87 [Phytophthora citrophthora]
MEEAPVLELSESEREEYDGKKAMIALQRALNGAGAWMVTTVRDQRKCDYPLLPTDMPANIRDKVAKILLERGGKEKVAAEIVDPKAPWHQQLEQHVARLMQQMRAQPQQFRELLMMAALESSSDCVVKAASFVDVRRACRRIRRAAMALGEEIFFMVRAFVRRSEVQGVLPQEAQVVRLVSLYKLELRRHVTISAVMGVIQHADRDRSASADKLDFDINTAPNKHIHPLLRRSARSADVTRRGSSRLDLDVSARASSAPADAGRQSQQSADPDKVKSVHAFKLQALERLLSKSWQSRKSFTVRSLQTAPRSPSKLSDETLAQIQERVTAFLYNRSRENYPLWSDPPMSREETARHLRTFVATLLTTPLLQGLTIDQLLEVARVARWQFLAPGGTLCERNTEIEALVVVMDGTLSSLAISESVSGPNSPPPGREVNISAPLCLGELGMVRNTERWTQTLTAQSLEGVKALLVSKLTFDALLHRFFSGNKTIPPGFAAVANIFQPRRPSSSPAVARRLARSLRPAYRPSTAAPTSVMEANITRWHEVRDEKLRDYRAGLEAEQRAAALEALQRAMEALSSTSPNDQDGEGFPGNSTSEFSADKDPWSRYEAYPHYDPRSSYRDSSNPEHDDLVENSHSSVDPPQPGGLISSTEYAEQLREFYRGLNARRSVMRSRLAYSAPSDQMVQLSPERKPSIVAPVESKTNESDSESPSTTPPKNQEEDSKETTSTQARKSALNILLARQSTAKMARHSKLLDKETAEQILIQKHFADSSSLKGLSSPSNRRQSVRPQLSLPTNPELHPSHSHAPLPLRVDLQRRMDSVLNDLLLPPKTKLDLVLKYTHADYYDQFPMAVQLWERVQGAITWRERIMKSLWDFELLASDPRRHFRSISTHRLREEKERDVLFYKLNQASNACLDSMDELWRCCGDTVCLGERSYRDKMKKDYTELLYEVEQERLRIIYDGVRPHVAPAVDENEVGVDSLSGGRPSSGRMLINVKMPTVGVNPPSLARRHPLNKKDGISPKISPGNNQGETTTSTSPQFAIDGANADPTSTRFSLITPRESIFIPISSKEEQSTKPEQISRASRVTVQVQQHRQAELAALSKQLEQKPEEPEELTPSSQAVRPPEKTFVAPTKEAEKSAARSKQQEDRASLREMFQQFMNRSR